MAADRHPYPGSTVTAPGESAVAVPVPISEQASLSVRHTVADDTPADSAGELAEGSGVENCTACYLVDNSRSACSVRKMTRIPEPQRSCLHYILLYWQSTVSP